MTKVNINNEWVKYDYAVDVSRSNPDLMLLDLQNRGITAEYLGESTAIKVDNKVICLNKRHFFFKYL